MWTSVGQKSKEEGLNGACITKVWDENSHYFTNKQYGEGFKALVKEYK